MNVVQQLEKLLGTPELPSLGPDARAGRRDVSSLERELTSILNTARFDGTSQKLIRSLVLLWHDHLDASHTISQDIHTADGSFVHGIMHRREPDYWNAKYWFNRVGKHAAFPEVAKEVAALGTNELTGKLVTKEGWDACGFVDACERASKNRTSPDYQFLQRVQQVETNVLLRMFAADARIH